MGIRRHGFGIDGVLSLALLATSLAGCNGGGGNGSASDGGSSGGSNGQSGAGGGGQSGAGGGGQSGGAGTGGGGNVDAGACAVGTTFQGQPGTLYVAHRSDGVLTAFDTQTGAQLKTITTPGSSNGIVGGNGLLWLWNTTNNNKLTPFQPSSGQALTALDIDLNSAPVFAGSSLWAFGFDTNVIPNVYSISSPTSVKALPVQGVNMQYYTANAFTAGTEGFFFLGATGVGTNTGSPEVVHVDAADSKIAWHLSVASVPALQGWPSTGEPSMAAVPGKVFVKISDPTADHIFAVDTAAQTVGTSATLDFNSGNNSLNALMTDGGGLYAFDTGIETLYEIDSSTFAMKRKLPLKGAADGDDTHILNPLVAAGAVWLGRICGGNTYVRRVDLASWTVADIPYPAGMGSAAAGYAYLAP